MAKEHNRSDLRSCYAGETSQRTRSQIIKQGLTRPLIVLIKSPIVLILAGFVSWVYGLFYLLFATVSSTFTDSYGWSAEISGLAYLSLGAGLFIGVITVARTSDRAILALTKKNNGVFEPEMRLSPMIFFAIIVPITFFWYGWAADKHAHWIVTDLGLVPFGIAISGVFVLAQTYFVDAFPTHAASVVAAAIFFRSVSGALLPLAAPPLYASLGLGWGNSILGFLGIIMIPAPYLLWKYGGIIRNRYPVELDGK